MKRAQAALEFLMTYGWAILVVLVVIGALAYFGVLNPEILLPEKCTLESGMNCRDHRIDSTANAVTFRLENGKGKGIIVTNVTVVGDIVSQGCTASVWYWNTTTTVAGACDDATCAGCQASADFACPGTYCGGAYYKCNPYDAAYTGEFNTKIGLHIPNGDSAVVRVAGFTPMGDTCNVAEYSGKTKAKIYINWYFDDSSPQFLHTMEGELLARVEK